MPLHALALCDRRFEILSTQMVHWSDWFDPSFSGVSCACVCWCLAPSSCTRLPQAACPATMAGHALGGACGSQETCAASICYDAAHVDIACIPHKCGNAALGVCCDLRLCVDVLGAPCGQPCCLGLCAVGCCMLCVCCARAAGLSWEGALSQCAVLPRVLYRMAASVWLPSGLPSGPCTAVFGGGMCVSCAADMHACCISGGGAYPIQCPPLYTFLHSLQRQPLPGGLCWGCCRRYAKLGWLA